ncbi:MAG: hypothetical protein ACRDN8_02680, partial [Thermoleophilaceae bacterium]
LARSHERAAAALSGLSAAEPVEAAVREVAAAYSSLAASAGSGSPGRWDSAVKRVRRRDTYLAEVLSARD